MAKFHLPSLEEEQLAAWEKDDVFRKVLEKPSTKGNFVFFEGPPTANGKPGIHHVLTRAFKDVILRFRTMQGFHIDRKAGWDTHGLPVELQVEKELGFTKKQDIEDYGIGAFNKKCKESVWQYRDLWEKMTRRTAFWVDLADPYVTYENGYVESLWAVLKRVHEGGRLYKGFRITPHCPRCVTSLSSHELAQGYKDTEDPSVYVKFRVEGRETPTFFLVWTTTPWTLPANVALAVGADVRYVEVKMQEGGEVFILAKALLAALEGEYEVVREVAGSDLVGMSYVPLFRTMPHKESKIENAYKVYAGDFVSTADGTGIVHIAPAFGEDDGKLGKAHDLPTLFSVDSTGMVTMEVPGKGMFFKKADGDLMGDLAARGSLYKRGTVTHSYPFCWRCDTPILYYAKSSWYIRMEDLRDKLQANNAQVHWVPEHIKEGRFGEWLRGVKDWALSRERYWGTPLPVWGCGACGETTVVGSLAELEEKRLPRNTYFLQRHGEAQSNLTNTLCSWPEPVRDGGWGLTETGRTQVATAAAELKGKGIDLIFASKLTRTKETAGIIAKELGISEADIQYDDRLLEIDLGSYNGGPVAAYEEARRTMDRFTATPSGETLNDVRRRMVAFMKEMETTHRGKRILIVSHGDPLWMLQTVFRGLDKETILHWPHYNHTGQFIELPAFANAPYDDLGEVDVHRPFIDEVLLRCEKCENGVMTREKDVVDVWFDSGAMPFAQWHHPFENANRIDGDAATNFPADFISEAIDQTRGWFYTLLAVSTLLGKEVPPYKNVICLGHLLDKKGQKMSKSKGNVVDPWQMFEKHGADAVRFYLFTVNQPGEPKRFDEKGLEEVTKKVFLILWNVLSFWEMFKGEGENVDARGKSAHPLDKWLLAEFAALHAKVTADLEAYNIVDSGRAIAEFVNDLSTWYVRRSRDRFKSEDAAERAAAVATLGFVLRELSKLMAPFTPFVAEALWKATGGEGSVHLAEWSGEQVARHANEDIRRAMQVVRAAASVGLERRATAGMPVRQVLAKAVVTAPVALEEWMRAIIADELNVDAVEAVHDKSGTMTVELDTALTDDLKMRGAVRELTRNINDLRKQAKLTPQDRIAVRYMTDSGFWKQVLAAHGDRIRADVRADRILAEGADEQTEVAYGDEQIRIAIARV